MVNAQKLVKLSFILITIAMASTVVYTANFHYGVYVAVRNLQLKIQQVDVNILNQTKAPVTITLTVANPSNYQFTVQEVNQLLYLNNFDQFILAVTGARLKEIAAQSDIEITLTTSVPSRKIEQVMQTEEKTWLLYTSIILSGPLIGAFRLTDLSYFNG